MSKELKALFEGIQVAEGFEKKVETIFEVAVAEAAEDRITKQAKSLEESFDKRLKEAKEEFVKDADEKIEKKVDEAIVEWAAANAVGIDGHIKVGLAESFLAGLTQLFLEHQVAVPDADDKKIVESLEAELTSAKSQLQESIENASKLTTITEDYKRAEIIKELTEGLADTQRDRIQRLTKEFSFINESEFKEKLTIIVENFAPDQFKKKSEEVKPEDDEKIKAAKEKAIKEAEALKDKEDGKVMDEVTNESTIDPFMAEIMASIKSKK